MSVIISTWVAAGGKFKRYEMKNILNIRMPFFRQESLGQIYLEL